ncbi:hypothetical protein Athai_12860 [Actinocatenispora thailandica]|uniref:Polyketide cyclase n=1 Tax=Actinocatenispora thailandica TaxID=227318 RepID=A0A7R7HVH7_9ACTN|nr:hypothetical protein Athai_12860 [Actinocatenispora thailandica]
MVYEALLEPDRDPTRRWLRLLGDERAPRLVEADPPGLVVWSSLWGRRPDARVRFDIAVDASGAGSDVRWTLLVADPAPDSALLGHLRKRLNELINADLRYSFGQ